MKIIPALFALTLVPNVFAAGIDGKWELPAATSNGIRFDGSLVFADESVTTLNTCTFPDGVAVDASVSSPVQYSVKTLESHSVNTGPDAMHTCQVSIEPATIDYRVSGNALTLTSPSEPTPFVITRTPGTTGTGLNGSWSLPIADINGMKLSASFTFSDGSVTVSNTCLFADGATLTVSVESKTASSFRVLESKSGENNADPLHTCAASIATGTVDYSVNGDSLSLTAAGAPGPITLNRAR